MPIDTLRMVLIVLAIADLVAIRFVRAQMLGATGRGTAPTVNVSDRARGLFTVSVVVLALCLAVAIYGLFLFLIGGRGLDFYTFAFVSLLAMAVHFPRLAQWEEWANLILGVWAVLAPWLLGFAGVAYATYAHVIIGLVVAVLAAVELWMVSKRPVSTT